MKRYERLSVLLWTLLTLTCYAAKPGPAQPAHKPQRAPLPLYFCSAADEKHFGWLLHLIGSIHRVHFNDLGVIAVFDLGFTPAQRAYLQSIKKLEIINVEMTHPDLLKIFEIWPKPHSRLVRGWYAWKPVVLKQALDRYPYIFYLDAGCVVHKPIAELFEYIKERGYCLLENYEPIKNHATQYVKNKFCSNENAAILDGPSIIGGVQGLSRKVYKDYVVPMYHLSKEMDNFKDDGTVKGGFGWSWHDQTLFAIYAFKNKFKLTPSYQKTTLKVGNKEFTIDIGDSSSNDRHVAWHSRGKWKFAHEIRFKK